MIPMNCHLLLSEEFTYTIIEFVSKDGSDQTDQEVCYHEKDDIRLGSEVKRQGQSPAQEKEARGSKRDKNYGACSAV